MNELEGVKEALSEFQEQIENSANVLLTHSVDEKDLKAMRNQLAEILAMIQLLQREAERRSLGELKQLLSVVEVRLHEVLDMSQRRLMATASINTMH